MQTFAVQTSRQVRTSGPDPEQDRWSQPANDHHARICHMKFLTTTALAALIAGSLGAATLAPAFADDATSPAAAAATAAPATTAPSQDLARASDMNGPGGMMQHGMRGGFEQRDDLRANILDLACGDRGAEALAMGFVH